MEPHLYLKRGKKNILLVRYFDRLHFITLDHRMHYQVRDWFLAQPRTVEEMNKRQLSRSTVDLKDVRGVAMGGLGRGQVVQFYMTEGKRRYELYEDTDTDTVSVLFHGLESFTPPKQQIAWQDWRLTQQTPELRKILWFMGGAMNVVGLLSGWFTMYSGFHLPWANVLSLICFVMALVLYFRYPAYYTILGHRRKYGERKSSFGLYPVVLFVPVTQIAAALYNYHVFSWQRAWSIGAVAVMALAVLLRKFAREFRDPGEFIGFILVGTILSAGPVLTVNFLMDFAPESIACAQIVDVEKTSGRGGDYHYFYVELDDKKIKLPVGKNIYEANTVGDLVTVELHEGAFGIPYAEID